MRQTGHGPRVVDCAVYHQRGFNVQEVEFEEMLVQGERMLADALMERHDEWSVSQAGYGGVALNSGVSQSGLSFSGDSYAAFSDSITVTVPTSGGVLDLSWLYYSAAQPGIELGTCSPVLFNINGTTATSPPGGCAFGLVGQGVPFSSGVPVPIAASISGTVDLSSGMSQQSYIRLQYIEAVDFASASVQAASGTEYSLIVTSPEPSSLALFALASGLILARRRLFG